MSEPPASSPHDPLRPADDSAARPKSAHPADAAGAATASSGAPATTSRATAVAAPSLADELYASPQSFDFFQAVRLLERLDPLRLPAGRGATVADEAVRFAVRPSLSFPPSAIDDLTPGSVDHPPLMSVNFLGLTGPNGPLPRHYTERLIRQQRDARGRARYALRDWLDMFHHRLIALFFRGWEKYRFWVGYERREFARRSPDTFTAALWSLIGLGLPSLRGRLRTRSAQIDDVALLRYAGFFAQRRRSAANLAALVRDYFRVKVVVQQFQGQWLRLDRVDLTQLGASGGHNQLGGDAVLGERVWDQPSKFRLRLGPLGYDDFREWMPDTSREPRRHRLALLSKLVRLFVGPSLDFDVELVLNGREVPRCQLVGNRLTGPRLGWNTWLVGGPVEHDLADARFAARD